MIHSLQLRLLERAQGAKILKGKVGHVQRLSRRGKRCHLPFSEEAGPRGLLLFFLLASGKHQQNNQPKPPHGTLLTRILNTLASAPSPYATTMKEPALRENRSPGLRPFATRPPLVRDTFTRSQSGTHGPRACTS